MSIRQQAREAWEDAQQRATAAFTWPMEEPRSVDPSGDPQYPYFRRHEVQTMRDRDAYEPERLALYSAKLARLDDYDPERHDWQYHVPEGERPFNDGDGAIYSLEYLKRRYGA